MAIPTNVPSGSAATPPPRPTSSPPGNTPPETPPTSWRDRLAALGNLPAFFKIAYQTAPGLFIGNAVVRNRMKRRLRALARALLPAHGIAGADHVLIGRDSGVERDFAVLTAELTNALARAAR